MIVDIALGCWIYDDDLARLVDDGCPHTQDETGRAECQECCGTHMRMWCANYAVYSFCPDCLTDGVDYHEDCGRSVPWGYLL